MKRPEDFDHGGRRDDKGVNRPLPLFTPHDGDTVPRPEDPVRVLQLPLFEER